MEDNDIHGCVPDGEVVCHCGMSLANESWRVRAGNCFLALIGGFPGWLLLGQIDSWQMFLSNNYTYKFRVIY